MLHIKKNKALQAFFYAEKQKQKWLLIRKSLKLQDLHTQL